MSNWQEHISIIWFCIMQGGWEDDESVESAAKRETVEEAGVRGKLEVC